MKKLIIFLLSFVVAISQNIEPPQRTFDYKNLNGQSINGYLNGDLDYFKINDFIIGWMWGGERKISQVMKANQADMGTNDPQYIFTNPNSYNDNTNLFVRAKWDNGALYTHCYYDNEIMFTKSLSYSAALSIDPNDEYKLVKLPNDPENHVFGFKYKHLNCTTVQSADDNRWRLVVDDDIIQPNTVILENPWPNNYLTYVEDLSKPTINENFSGRTYYVSINLRRLENTTPLYGDEPVLKIVVPYKYRYNNALKTVNAKFDKLPNNYPYDFAVTPYGHYWNCIDVFNKPTEMIITKNMLPELTSNFNGDITISGRIDFDGTDPLGNHIIKEHPFIAAENQIEQLNLEVKYMGNCKIAINWIKFESPNARKLLSGDYDEYIFDGVQDALTTLTTSGFTSRGIKPVRFTVNVEGSPINWAAERHFSKLVGNIITGSNGVSLPYHYDYYINSVDKWMSFSNIHSYISNPFNGYNEINYKTGTNEWKTMGLATGYKIKAPTKETADLFDSEWETYLRYDNTKTTSELVEEMRGAPLDVYTDSEKLAYAGGPMSIQGYWENKQYSRLYHQFSTGFQYSDKPWFAQSFVENFVYKAPVDASHISYSLVTPDGFRIVTAEEFKLMNWNALILGAKGLIYDGDSDQPEDAFITSPNLRLLPTEYELMDRMDIDLPTLLNMDDDVFINHPQSTSDFLDHTYDHLNLYNGNHNLDIVAATMDVPKNRIFVGKRSIRREMKRLHDWALYNESTLMDLRLQAWYGKGYKILYNQHPKWNNLFFSTDKIKEFINVDKLITSKISGVETGGYTNEKVVESTYESFLDLTLLV